MGQHLSRYNRGDPVAIVSGRYQGHPGVVDSAVFQQTVDRPDEFAPLAAPPLGTPQ